jgi:hypothetical protein
MIVNMQESANTVFSDIAGYTAEIRHLEEKRAIVAEKRRGAVLRHAANGHSDAAMARATGLSEPAISKIRKGGPSLKAQRRGATV